MVNFIKVSDIDDLDRLRRVDLDHVDVLATSMRESGLNGPRQAIVVRPDPDGVLPYRLVVGAHRLWACKKNAWLDLEVGRHVVVEEMTDDEARLTEVDENLARHELSALDRAVFLLERQRVYQILFPETARGKAKKNKDEEKGQTLVFSPGSFSRSAGKKLGLSKSAIDLAITIAKSLPKDVVRDLSETKVARNQRELLALTALDCEQQRDVAALIKAGAAKTVLQAKINLGMEAPKISTPEARRHSQFMDIWRLMSPAERDRALADIGAELKLSPVAPAPKGARK